MKWDLATGPVNVIRVQLERSEGEAAVVLGVCPSRTPAGIRPSRHIIIPRRLWSMFRRTLAEAEREMARRGWLDPEEEAP